MKIDQLFKEKETVLSFEIFPPKREGDVSTIYKTLDELSVLNPDYISVTYGAAGTERDDKTLRIASAIQNDYHINALAHLTCVGSTEKEMGEILRKFEAENIHNILALRGDLPDNSKEALHSFHYASDLVAFIKKETDFCIAGACYPEPHIEARSRVSDIFHLKNKVEKGTDFLVTQLFFDNQYFYDLKEDLESLDINVPITVGIMPPINKKQIERMVALCGTTLPTKFKKIFHKYENKPEALKEAGIIYATEQIIDLVSSGVDGIHLYVMNKPDLAKKLVNNVQGILNV